MRFVDPPAGKTKKLPANGLIRVPAIPELGPGDHARFKCRWSNSKFEGFARPCQSPPEQSLRSIHRGEHVNMTGGLLDGYSAGRRINRSDSLRQVVCDRVAHHIPQGDHPGQISWMTMDPPIKQAPAKRQGQWSDAGRAIDEDMLQHQKLGHGGCQRGRDRKSGRPESLSSAPNCETHFSSDSLQTFPCAPLSTI